MSLSAQLVKNVSITFASESISLPFTRLGPFNPGGEIGVTVREVDRNRSIRRVNVYLGAFRHERVASAIYLRGEYQFTWKVTDRIGLDFPLGIGYLHSFYPAPVYEVNEEGKFKEVDQWGKPRALVNAGIGLSFQTNGRIHPFIKHEFFIEGPVNPGLILLAHSFFKIGILINI